MGKNRDRRRRQTALREADAFVRKMLIFCLLFWIALIASVLSIPFLGIYGHLWMISLPVIFVFFTVFILRKKTALSWKRFREHSR